MVALRKPLTSHSEHVHVAGAEVDRGCFVSGPEIIPAPVKNDAIRDPDWCDRITRHRSVLFRTRSGNAERIRSLVVTHLPAIITSTFSFLAQRAVRALGHPNMRESSSRVMYVGVFTRPPRRARIPRHPRARFPPGRAALRAP